LDKLNITNNNKLPMPPHRSCPGHALHALLSGLLCLVAFLALPAHADKAPLLTLTSDRHEYDVAATAQYLVDREGDLTIAQLLRESDTRRWLPTAGTSWSFGLSDNAYWFRFRLINHTAADADTLLEIHYPLLDHIELYVVQEGRVIHQARAGDALPYAARPFPVRNFLFKPPLPQGEAVTIYARVKTKGSVLTPFILWHDHDFYRHEQQEIITHGLYFGILLAFALYNLLLFWFTREGAFFYYTLYISSLGLFQAALFGLGYQYLWPGAVVFQHYSIPLFMFIALFAALRFAASFLPLRRYCPIGVSLLRTITPLPLLLLALLAFIPYSIAIKLGLLLTLLGAGLLLLTSFIVWWRARGESGYFFFAWFTFLVASIVSATDKLGTGGLGLLADHVMQLGVVVQLAAFSVALAKRLQAEKQQRIDAQHQAKVKLEQMVTERTAELEEANRRLDAMSHTDGLTGLKNRRLFDEELDRQFRAAVRNRTPLSLAMLDIDLFKQLNDRYGHQVGDDFLRLIASVIAAEARRPLDSACRYGGEEFALILPNTSAEGVQQIAECIRSGVENIRHRVGEQWVPVTISSGTATLTPGFNDGPSTLVEAADSALYEAKTQGRNRVVHDQRATPSPRSLARR
jgi:diguanylate cyclase